MVVQKNMAKWHLKGHTAVKGYHYGDKRGKWYLRSNKEC